MRPGLAFLLAVVLLSSALPSAEAQGERDRQKEVLDGASVQAYLAYEGTVQHQYSGGDGYYAARAERGDRVSWSGTLELQRGAPGEVTGSLLATWKASASKTRHWSAINEHSSYTEDTTCQGSGQGDVALQVTGVPEAAGLRVTIQGYVMPSMTIPGGCRSDIVDVRGGERESHSTSGEFGGNVALLHQSSGDVYQADVTFLVPYDSASTQRFDHRETLPIRGDSAGSRYCNVQDSQSWISGTCVAAGTLTIRNLVDPCPYLKRIHPAHVGELASVASPVGLDEAGIRAWSQGVQQVIHQVLGEQRTWQLVGCAGDLEPDPWPAMERAMKLKRDALLKLLREGKLSQEGIGELLGTERGLQLIGAADDSVNVLGEIQAAAEKGPPPAGTMEVRVHSPVSLHVYDEAGGHVGWDAASNASVSTIAGATYEGAPGGAQTIRLPAGFYKVVVDELDAGGYLLEVETNGTGADTIDAHIVESRAGRTTSTHYAVTEGWEGARLDAFPVRRGSTPDSVAFVDEGRPPSGRAGGPGAGGVEGVGRGGEDDEGDGGRDAPGPGIGVGLLAVALVAVAAARARRP